MASTQALKGTLKPMLHRIGQKAKDKHNNFLGIAKPVPATPAPRMGVLREGGGISASRKRKVQKNMNQSAFGVQHDTTISKSGYGMSCVPKGQLKSIKGSGKKAKATDKVKR